MIRMWLTGIKDTYFNLFQSKILSGFEHYLFITERYDKTGIAVNIFLLKGL